MHALAWVGASALGGVLGIPFYQVCGAAGVCRSLAGASQIESPSCSSGMSITTAAKGQRAGLGQVFQPFGESGKVSWRQGRWPLAGSPEDE